MKLAKFVKHGLCIFTSIAVMGTLAGCGGQAGSMNKGKLVKNCSLRFQPDTGFHGDEGGI